MSALVQHRRRRVGQEQSPRHRLPRQQRQPVPLPEVHPVASIFPPMEGAEYEAFKADVAAAGGVREPAWLYEGKLIDGRNRARACQDLGLELPTRTWDGTGCDGEPASLVGFVLSLNLHRRHLTSGQRAALAVDVERLLAAEAKARQRAAGGDKSGGGRQVPRRGSPAVRGAGALQERFPEAPRNGSGHELATGERADGGRSAAAAGGSASSAASGQARDQAAKLTGTNGRYVSDAKLVAEQDPGLFERVKSGDVTLPRAKRHVQREQRRRELTSKAARAAAAAAASAATAAVEPWELVAGDCLDVMGRWSRARRQFRLVFADPPYNEGVDYGGGPAADRLPDAKYAAWTRSWVKAAADLLTDDGSMWVLISEDWADRFGLILREAGLHRRRWVVWHESFGVNCSTNFGRCARHLFYTIKDPRRFVFNRDAVTVPSARQLVYGDKRADPAGKIIDNVWHDIPRLVDNAAERLADFPTQLPSALLERVVGCCSDSGDACLDPFAGSGSLLRACLKLGRVGVGVDVNAQYVRDAALSLRVLAADLAAGGKAS